MISARARPLLADPPPLVEAHLRCAADPWDARHNPDGYLNFGTAENHRVEAEMLAAVRRLQADSLKAGDLHYHDPAGSAELRGAFARFQTRFHGVPPMPASQVVVASGVSALLESLAYCLLDPGDAVLGLAPLYSGFWHDLETRFHARLVTSAALDGARIDFDRLERDIAATRSLRALLICNPHNPWGICLHPEDLAGLLRTARAHRLEVIADEIYASSVFGPPPFVSCLDPRFDDIGWREHVHRVWGLAKDLGLSGFKTGFYASPQPEAAAAMAQCAYFHTVSMQTQRLAQRLLDDHDFCRALFETSTARLRANFVRLRDGLQALGIGVHPSHAGVFTMVDLRGRFGVADADAEDRLFRRLLDQYRINITPGRYFAHPVPGVFRVCFAQPPERLDALLARLAEG